MPRSPRCLRFPFPVLAFLLLGCNDTAAEPVEPQPTEPRPALGSPSTGAEPKDEPKADPEKAESDLQAVLKAIEDAEKKLATLRRQASDLRRTIAARRGPGKTYSIEQLFQGAPYDMWPGTTLERERFGTWLAENVKGKRVSYKFKLNKSDHGWQVFKTKEGRYRVSFSMRYIVPKFGGKNIRVIFNSDLIVQPASLEMVDRLENLAGKEVTIDLDIAAIRGGPTNFYTVLVVAPRNVCIDGLVIPEALRKTNPFHR